MEAERGSVKEAKGGGGESGGGKESDDEEPRCVDGANLGVASRLGREEKHLL